MESDLTTDQHLPFIRIHKNGHVERLRGNDIVPASLNPQNDVVDGVNDPWFNVVGSGWDISGLGCERVLVAVAGKDVFWRQGLEKSGWKGEIELVEEEEEGHCFHLHSPNSENALKTMKSFVEFIES